MNQSEFLDLILTLRRTCTIQHVAKSIAGPHSSPRALSGFERHALASPHPDLSSSTCSVGLWFCTVRLDWFILEHTLCPEGWIHSAQVKVIFRYCHG